jgi:hypothetical protein
MDQVTQLLTQQGYTGITGLHESGRDWGWRGRKEPNLIEPCGAAELVETSPPRLYLSTMAPRTL